MLRMRVSGGWGLQNPNIWLWDYKNPKEQGYRVGDPFTFLAQERFVTLRQWIRRLQIPNRVLSDNKNPKEQGEGYIYKP